jgi:hypothetical protein
VRGNKAFKNTSLIDGSQSSKQAVGSAINIARKYNSRLVATRVFFSHILSAYSLSGVFSGLTIPNCKNGPGVY